MRTPRWTSLDPKDQPATQALERGRTACCGPLGRCYSLAQTAQVDGVEMLDAYIIDRIRRERESQQPGQQQRIEMPMHDRWHDRDPRERQRREQDRDRDSDRGVAIIDFSI